MMKKLISLLLVLSSVFTLCSCKYDNQEELKAVPQAARIKSICELATMECYYHNVAKYFEEDAGGPFWNKKDKHFWVKYSGQVRVGIDVTQMQITIDGEHITISMPPAKVLDSKVDSDTLNQDSFIFAAGSIMPSAAEQTKAIGEAKKKMDETASQDTMLLSMAQERAISLIQRYIDRIAEETDVPYQITWLSEDSAPLPSPEPQEETEEPSE